MGPEWDAVVCGGGAAGLVLAAELAGPGGPLGRVLVVDDGAHPVDRWTLLWRPSPWPFLRSARRVLAG